MRSHRPWKHRADGNQKAHDRCKPAVRAHQPSESDQILNEKRMKLKPLWQWSLLHRMVFTSNIREYV